MKDLSIKEGLIRLSQINSDKISISKIIDRLGENAAKIIVIIFCAPTALPTPALPVLTQLLSAVVLITLGQLIIKKQKIWLPKKIMNSEMKSKNVMDSATKLTLYHKKIEKFVRPRLKFLNFSPFDQIIYIFCCFLSIVVALPIPFSNTVPSIAIIVIMLGMIERDGFIIIFGIFTGIFGVTTLFLLYFYGINLIT